MEPGGLGVFGNTVVKRKSVKIIQRVQKAEETVTVHPRDIGFSVNSVPRSKMVRERKVKKSARNSMV